MSDPTFSDIDFENKIAYVWTTLNSHSTCGKRNVLRMLRASMDERAKKGSRNWFDI